MIVRLGVWEWGDWGWGLGGGLGGLVVWWFGGI